MIKKAIVFFHRHSPIPRIRQGYRDVITEVKRCHWLSMPELMQYTGLVIVMLVAMAAFIAVTDLTLRRLVMEIFRLPSRF